MFNKKIKILIIVVIVIIVVVVGYLLYQYFNKPSAVSVEQEIQVLEEAPKQEFEFTAPAMSASQKEQKLLEGQALIFAERFGTFSYYENFSSLQDLQPMTTVSFYQWIQNTYKGDLEAKYSQQTLSFGVITQAIAVEFVDYSDSQAQVIVTTKRTERNNEQDITYDKDLRLNWVKQGGNWLINGAYWQN